MHNINFFEKRDFEKIGGDPGQKVEVGNFFLQIQLSRKEALVKSAIDFSIRHSLNPCFELFRDP